MQLCPATVLKCQEAIPISNNEMRKIHRGGEEQPARPVGRKVNVSQSRREVHSAAENRTRAPKAPKSPKPPKEKSKHPILRFIGRTVATVLCLGIMLGSVVAVGMVFYVVQATANDGDLLDLDNIQLSQSSMVVATDPDTGAQVEYATLRSSNSHRVWADLEQIPSNLQYAFICTEDKDFYSEPGVNFKRTIGAMINEYLLPIYSSKQGASTLEQQLIKNLTDDNSASGIDGALRKVREIYRALCLSRSYSKETILEAYLNTISFTGTIQGVQTAANEYFNKDVSQLSLWECATIASITKNPTNYNPYTNPENLIHRRNFIMYNMWQQGVISEEDYRNGAAQPLVLAEEDSGKKPSTVTSYFTDALFQEVVEDIMAKEGISALIANTITGVSSNPAVVMFIINIILLILGMVMEPGAILTLMLPVLLPIADTMGYNLVYFGVVVVLNLMIGQVTPPFGVCLFVISDVNKIKLERIYKSILPFLVPLLITLAVTCIFPQVVTFLPDMLLGATAA